MTTENISWEELKIFVEQVAEYYEDKDIMPTGVYGVPRGGLVLAVILSHKLAIPLLMAPYDGCLIVDDITDSGESLLHYDRMGYDIMTIVKGPDSKVEPKLYYTERHADWVRFCWEGNFSQTLQDANNYYAKKGDGIL